MITRDLDRFLSIAGGIQPDFGPAWPRAAFLVSPEGFSPGADSALDNRYMADGANPQRALDQHRELHRALNVELPVICFAGDPATPEAVFANNVFATARTDGAGRLLIARMHHPSRRAEAERADIRRFFGTVLGYTEHDLRAGTGVGELTGSLVIDRARGLGFCGLSARCDEAGARAMHSAFGLRATLMFDLAEGEYHTNVVLAALADRAVMLAGDGFANPAVADAIAGLFPHAIRLSGVERMAFAGNAIALGPTRVWLSATAAKALSATSRSGLERAGFAVASVALDEIERAGGSLRCCVTEIF